MIRINRFPEPSTFHNLVEKPGLKYLHTNPHPTSNEFRKHAYWQRIHNDIYTLYNGICAYCASWSPRSSKSPNQTSIDHFIPKCEYPIGAYNWENYRLCRARINANKGDNPQIVDPFYVNNDWFQIDFSTFLILANCNSPPYAFYRIQATIDCLELNGNDYVNERIQIIREYCLGRTTLSNLRAKYPFIASEIVRCNFDTAFRPSMSAYFGRIP